MFIVVYKEKEALYSSEMSLPLMNVLSNTYVLIWPRKSEPLDGMKKILTLYISGHFLALFVTETLRTDF